MPDLRTNGKFVTDDQKIMSKATRYLEYQAELAIPYVRGDVLEIGAGIGNLAKEVLERAADKINTFTCIEAETLCCERLREELKSFQVNMSIVQGLFPDTLPESTFDMIYHFNVLEHIEEDQQSLQCAFHLLNPGGTLCMFIPAFPMLYGSMDKRLRHFRRYAKQSIKTQMKQAGFQLLESRYCNFIGFFGWYINNRLLKIQSQQGGQVALFDKVILPVQKTIESWIEPPLGQNLWVVGQKPFSDIPEKA